MNTPALQVSKCNLFSALQVKVFVLYMLLNIMLWQCYEFCKAFQHDDSFDWCGKVSFRVGCATSGGTVKMFTGRFHCMKKLNTLMMRVSINVEHLVHLLYWLYYSRLWFFLGLLIICPTLHPTRNLYGWVICREKWSDIAADFPHFVFSTSVRNLWVILDEKLTTPVAEHFLFTFIQCCNYLHLSLVG